MNATIVLGKQGRVVIPAEIREQLGLAAGDRCTYASRAHVS
jgi:AbrB family looped-hinge helix DNA binding protein